MKDFKKLKVWQEAMQNTLLVYEVTINFPTDERFGLTSQLRRASVSIVSNIAEGCCRDTDVEKARFMDIALSSAFEVDCQLLIAQAIGYAKAEETDVAIEKLKGLQRGIASLAKYLRTGKRSETKPAQTPID